jgi:glutathione S-transferase
MLTFFSYTISPYAAKVRAVLRYKQIPFQERVVHPMRRGEVRRLSGQSLVPIVDDEGHVVADSTRIVAYLDERYPDRPVIPRDPGLRARALMLEEWADDGLGASVQPVRWFIAANARRTSARFRSGYPPGLVDDIRMALVSSVLRLDLRRKYGGRSLVAPPPAAILTRLATMLDVVEGALAETGWLAGPSPTVADFAAFGWFSLLDGLDGWDLVQARPRLARLLRTLSEPANHPASPGDQQPRKSPPHGANGTPASRPPT